MIGILKDTFFNEHYQTGFVETGMTLPSSLLEEVKENFQRKADGHLDFPKFFVNNEHQAYIEGKFVGFLLNTFPKFAKKTVTKLYDRTYKKAIYGDQTSIENVLKYLLANDFKKFFQTRYLVASYDVHFCNDYTRPGATLHTDLPNFHHFYETENDLSIFVPLVDLDETNGGRIFVLPESKIKVPGNVLLKLMYEYFSENPGCTDANGYVDPDKISQKDIVKFVKTKPHQELMTLYKSLITLVKKEYSDAFNKTVETKGKVLLFSNKNFHAVEPWKNEQYNRESYVIRLSPIYDVKIKLRRNLHGTLFNNFLIDTKTGELTRYDDPVDFSTISDSDKLKI